MKQNLPTKEAKSKVDKKPYSSSTPPQEFPLWFVTSFILFLTSLVSLIYYFLRGSKPKSQQQNSSAVQVLESRRLARDGIKSESVSNASVKNVEQPAHQGNSVKTNTRVNDGPNIQKKNPPLFRWLDQNRLFVGLAALIFGVAGQFILSAKKPLIGVFVIGIAILLFVITFWKQSGVGIAALSIQQPLKPRLSLRSNVALGLAVLFSGLAFWLFGVSSVPSNYPWLLYLASIGLLILSSFWANEFPADALKNEQNNKVKWNWLEIVIFLAILLVAAFMRLYRFDQIPFGIWYDEADNGLVALRILNESGYLPVFATTLPAHLFYIIALFFKIFGASILSLRAVSVAFGLGTVVAAFFVGTELFNRKMGFVIAFFLAVSRWDINWSRIGMHAASVPFFELLSVGLILRALRTQRLMDYSLVGLSLGLGFCFYTPLYIFPVIIGSFLLYLWLGRHDLFFSSWRGIVVLALGVFIASVPISQYAIRESDSFSDRMSVTSIFTGKSSQDGWKAVAKTTREHLLMFNYFGDRNGRHNLPGEPMLDPISGALLLLGVGLSLRRIRQPGSFLLIIWLLIMLIPGIFSLDFESPQSLRAIGSLPAAYLLVAVPIYALWQEWERTSRERAVVAFAAPLILFLIGVGAINYHIYFDLQAQNSDSWRSFSTPETIVGKTMAELGPQVDNYVSVFYYNIPTVQFLAPEIKEYHALQTYDTLPIPADGKKTMVFYVDADRKPFFLQAKHYYPNAGFKEYKTPDGTTVLYQVILKPSDIAASQGITTSYYRHANWSGEPFLVTTEKTIDADWTDGNPAQFPFGVKWQGVLYADHYGIYRLSLQSPAPSELYVDNVQIHLTGEGVQTAEVELAKGTHELIIKTLGKEGHFELDWQPPDGELAPIPSSYLFLPPISNNGLLGKYFSNGDWQGPPAFTEIDPWIHFNFHIQPLPRPYTVEWVGRINIVREGHYHFALESIDESSLFIDDKQVVNTLENNKYTDGEIDLLSGIHSIRLRFADRTGHTYVNFYWTPPDSEQESVPQEVLFLP